MYKIDYNLKQLLFRVIKSTIIIQLNNYLKSLELQPW